MRSNLFASGLAIVLGVGSPIVSVVGFPEVAIAQPIIGEVDLAIGNGIALLMLDSGNVESLRKAIVHLEKGLGLARSAGSKDKQALSLLSLGRVYSNLGENQKALEYYNETLLIYRMLGDRSGEAITLNNISLVYSNLGENQKALESYHQALPLYRGLGDRSGEATTLNNMGLVYSNLGENQKALESYHQALRLIRTVGDRSGEGILGVMLDMNDQSGEAGIISNIGSIYSALGEKQKALDHYNQALSILRVAGNPSSVATILNNIGSIYSALGENQKALEYYNQALAISVAAGNRPTGAKTLTNMGQAYSALGENQKALDYYNQALSLSRSVGDRPVEAKTLNNIGTLLESQKQPQIAIVFLKQSISLYETLRQDIRTLPKETQQAYTKTVEGTYRKLADLLLKADRILEAQQVLDLLKVQELNTYLKNVRGASQPIENLPPETEILKKYNAIQTSAIALGQELTTLRQTPEPSRTRQQIDRITQLDKLQDELNQQFNQFTDRPDIKTLIEALSPKVRRQTVDTADLNALRANLKQLNAVMIYPLILDDRLELIITTPDSPPLRRTVNVKREDLNQEILAFRSALQSESHHINRHAQKLYNWLIKPLEADLKVSNPKTLIYAPDGQLRYIPIAALHDGNQWLIERYAINLITAKSLTNLTQHPTQQPKILAGAIGGKAEEATSVTVGTRSFTFGGLPATNIEIDSIQALQPSTNLLKATQFILPNVKPKLADYNILHLATHAAIVPGNPEDSFILFNNKTVATLKDIENWTLSNFDLVVLSACETGLAGNFGTNGEEILGLGYQFQNRGAKATIASLWKVADDSTQQLMTEFYTALKAGQSKTQALQTAQRSLIARQPNQSAGVRSDLEPKPTGTPAQSIAPKLIHPYYWAPFILIGNGL
jgi:CHAT domain-containing protein/tetratricopeptide (TPR) repeat protein